MKRISILLLILFSTISLFAQTKIIFDTDIDTDCDDGGALAVLHALADNGEAEILATIVSTRYPYSAPCVEAINRYYGRPDIPIGAPKTTWADTGGRGSPYAEEVATEYVTTLNSNDDAPDAVDVYRQILAGQEDNSVVILTIGYLTNIRDLLESGPDEFSPLNGVDLVIKKVSRWVQTGAAYPNDYNPAVRGNYPPDPKSAYIAFRDWPEASVPMYISGEGDIKTGASLASTPVSNPVRRMYELLVGLGNPRGSADQIGTLFAVRPDNARWTFRTNGYYQLFENGTFEWRTTPDKNHTVLEYNTSLNTELIQTLNQLMVQPPKFTAPKIENLGVVANAVFKNMFGDWNVSTNWQSNHIPDANDNVIIAEKSTAMISSEPNKCGIVFCGQFDVTSQWSKVIIRRGGSLNAAGLVLGKNNNNHGIFLICGGKLNISKYLQIGDGNGKSTGSGEMLLSAGNLKMAKKAPVFIGYKGKGEMIISWKGILEANDVTVAESPGTQGSVLEVIGGKLIADNITVNSHDAEVPSKIIIAGGKVEWNNHFIVNDVLEIQNSSAVITARLKNGVGLSFEKGSSLEFEFGAKGIAPIDLSKSKISIASSAKLRISGTYYTRANGKPGSFLLIKHNGYGNKSIFKNVKITGFGNLKPSLRYKKKSVFLDLKEKTTKIVDRSDQGIFMKYWELPIDYDGDKTVIFPPLTYMPDFTNSLVRTHPIFGKAVRKIDLSEALRGTNILVQFKGLINIPKTGKYNFWIKYNEAARLKIDDVSIGKDKPGKSTVTLNLTNGMHKIEVGYYQNDSDAILQAYWKGPGFSKQEIPEEAFFIPNPKKDFSKFYSFGNIMPDQERIYNYCPTFMFDEDEGLYKIWSGGAGAGDFILYKESPTLEKLLSCPTLNQLYPLHDDMFDEIHCCDPSVYIDKNGVFYLTYSGCSDGKPLGKATRIGMAISHDKGRRWKRLHNGEHIIGPKKPEGGYGTGQSAAVLANDGYHYLIYTDADAAHPGQYLGVFKCSDPAFPKNGLIFVTNGLHYGASVDLAYDSKKEEFIVISNVSSDPDKTSHPYAGIRLVYFDKNWKKLRTIYLKADTSWSFGEGASFLTDMRKNPLKYSYHENDAYVFAAATQSYEGDTRLWAEWVEGDTRYLMFEIPESETN